MIGIFRTNINTTQEKNRVIRALVSRFAVATCSVDIEDCDKVLRIISPQALAEQTIVDFVQQLGFNCAVLD